MTHIFWGYILIFFHLKINEFDLLPDFLGYVLICIGLSKLLYESINFKKAIPYAIFMTIISIFITFGGLLGISFNGEIFGIFNFITILIFIYIKYLIVMGIKDIEQSYNATLGFSSLFLIWKISFGLVVAIKTFVITRNEMFLLLGAVLTAIALCVNIVFLVYFYKAKKIYEGFNKK